jgi:signal transduction histidine kinase
MKNQTTIRDEVAPGRQSFPTRFKMLTPVKSVQEETGEYGSFVHEIRNPLSTISLSAEMLKSILPDNDHKVLLDVIIRGSMRISDILTDIFSYFRGNKTAAEEEYSIHQLLEEVLTMAGDKIMLKHITIRKNYDAKDFKMLLNGSQMKTALTNIIINAIDAMAGIKGKLTLVTKSTEHTCIVQIKDNGCGISQENLKKIFQPYFTSKPGGLGLGLAATQHILRSNRVRLKVKSTEAKGTNFILGFGKNVHNKPLQPIKIITSERQ